MAATSADGLTLTWGGFAGWALALFALAYALGGVNGTTATRAQLQPRLDTALRERDQAIALVYDRELGVDTLELVLDGIHGQESGHGENTGDDAAGTTTCNTAVGEYQVQPRTALWLRSLGRLDASEFPEQTCEAMAERLRTDAEASRKVARTFVVLLLERLGSYERALCGYNGLPSLPKCGYSDNVLARVRA